MTLEELYQPDMSISILVILDIQIPQNMNILSIILLN